MGFITSKHNRFYHALLNEVLTIDVLKCSDIEVNDTVFKFSPKKMFGTRKDGITRLKHLLRALDFNYPLDGEDKASSTKITDKELVDHIEYIYKLTSDNGYQFKHIEIEWERLLAQAHA